MIGTSPAPEDLVADLELLVDDRLDAVGIRRLDDRAHLRAEDAVASSRARAGVEVGHRLHDLRRRSARRRGPCPPSGRERPASPPTGTAAVPLPPISRSMVFSNRIAPRMRSPPKLGLVMMRVRISWTTGRTSPRRSSTRTRTDAVESQGLRRAAAALVEGGDETVLGLDLLALCFVAHGASWGLEAFYRGGSGASEAGGRPRFERKGYRHPAKGDRCGGPVRPCLTRRGPLRLETGDPRPHTAHGLVFSLVDACRKPFGRPRGSSSSAWSK